LYADSVVVEAARTGVTTETIVMRALGLYSLLADAIESGQQLVLQYMFDVPDGQERLLRIDHYLPPSPTVDLTEGAAVLPERRTHAELASWPPDQS
jgi:hypothetical protein